MNDLEILKAALRNDFGLFNQRVFRTVSPGTPYLHNWHLDAIAYYLNLCATGEIKRLVVTMPPRHGKSNSTSVALPAWLLGRDPTTRILAASYAQDLSTKFSKDTKLVMESDWYRGLFRGTVLSDTTNTQAEFATTKHGYRLATSVGGGFTGRGGDILIIDDPHKADDAYSPVKRQATIDWYFQTAASRLDDPEDGCIIVIQQRFHEEDLAGVLLGTGKWHHLNLPAIAQVHETIPIGPGKVHRRAPGEALHPERVSLTKLNEMQADLGSLIFAGQYLQQPAPAGGGIVQWPWFKFYEVAPTPQYGDRIIQSWDHAFTKGEQSNYSACLTFLCRQDNFYVLDVFRGKMEFPQLLRFIPQYADKWKAGRVVLESSGAGVTLRQALHELDRQRYGWTNPTEDKVVRLMKASPYIENGRVFLPKEAPWLGAFRQEMLSFPNGKYDDQVDALSQFLGHWPRLRSWPFGIVADAGYAEPVDDAGSRLTLITRAPEMSIPDLFKMRLP